MDVFVKKGKENIKLKLINDNVKILKQKNFLHIEDEELIIERSINNPINSKSLEEIISINEKIAIIVSDITRPLPSYKILPILLKHLENIGCQKENITIVFALGAHRKQTETEKIQLVGEEIYKNYKCVDSDQDDVIKLGTTSRGTPVEITRVVAEADRRICIANIEYHYFAGYSGGAKSIMPGCSTKNAIQKNHSNMINKDAVVGNIKKNPIREDLEEAISFCSIDFIINVILNSNKDIVYAVSGNYLDAHRTGCKFLDDINCVEINSKADLVIVSQGGFPKDLNLYQTQKALDNAQHAVKDGGIIILVGSCEERFGDDIFESWLIGAKSPDELLMRIKKHFVLGGHKAAAIAKVSKKSRIFLVSEMKELRIDESIFKQYNDLQKAYDDAIRELPDNFSTIVIPSGGSILPRLKTLKN